MIYLIFDTETTGLPKNYQAPFKDIDNWPRLVQLSFIISNGKHRQEFNFIIKPNGFEIPEVASNIHGITTERALAAGVDVDFALTILRGFINIADVIVAHNFDFDKAIIGSEFYRQNETIGLGYEMKLASKKTFCTMKDQKIDKYRVEMGMTKWPKLIELYKHLFKEEFSGAHNSLMDTRACERVYFKVNDK